MDRTGGCRCGKIRYSAAGEPAHSAICHCADCRRSAGAPMVAWSLFARDAVTITGDPVTYESSPGIFRQFCGTCGTGLFYLNEATFPGQIDVQSATLDDPEALPPQVRIQAAEAPGWLGCFAEMPVFARYPAG